MDIAFMPLRIAIGSGWVCDLLTTTRVVEMVFILMDEVQTYVLSIDGIQTSF